MKKLLAGVALLALSAASALAADLPARMPTKAPAAVSPVYNWSGWYIGINGGGAWGRSNWRDTATGATTGDFNVSGGMIGGTVGANWQTGQWVFGLEGDADWANIKGSTATGCTPNCETKSNFFSTVRGRTGVAFGTVLPYLTGGLAIADIESGGRGLGTTSSTTKAGWTVGTGVEWAVVGPWTAKVEYLYADLGKASCSVAICGATGPTDVSLKENVVRAGLNYRFGGPMR